MLEFHHHHPHEEIQNSTSIRYRCNFCDFDLHEISRAISRPTLASFLHPQHELNPMFRTSSFNTTPPCHMCNFCGDDIEDHFYRCNICNFDLHPACTRLPEYISYHWHFIHQLRLESDPVGRCRTCSGVCTSWRYRCGTCGFNIHLGCMLPPPSSPPFPIQSPFYAGTVGIPPSGYVGIGVPAANYPVNNYNPQQYVNANQYASGSSGAVSSEGKSKFRKKAGSVVGRLAISIALHAMGIPDVFSFL